MTKAVSSSWIGSCGPDSEIQGCQLEPTEPSGWYLCHRYPPCIRPRRQKWKLAGQLRVAGAIKGVRYQRSVGGHI